MKLSRCGITLALVYILIAILIALYEFKCRDGVHFCGIGSMVITLPAQYVLQPVLIRHGMEINFLRAAPLDIALQTLNIGLCAILVYLIGWGIGWISLRILRLIGVHKT